MKILPAIDIKDGQCVRLQKGNFDKIDVYSDSPLDQAKLFKENGFNFIHIIDLDGALEGKRINTKIINQIVDMDIKLQIGGGIRTILDIKNLLNLGVERVILGTAIVENNEFLLEVLSKFDNNRITFALDFRIEKNIPLIATNGWTSQTSINLCEFIKIHNFVNVLATDIDKDGLLSGPNLDIYNDIKNISSSVNIIGSGGITSMDDINDLKKIGIRECVIGKAIYEKKLSMKELSSVN